MDWWCISPARAGICKGFELKVEQLFDQIRSLWLAEAEKGAVIDWALYELIESRVTGVDHWADLSNWAFYQAMNNSSGTVFDIKSVSIESFTASLRGNLRDPSWENELAAFQVANPELNF
jgi:hypothetical protein